MSDDWRTIRFQDCCDLVKSKSDPLTLSADTAYVGLEHITPSVGRLTGVGFSTDVSSLVSVFHADDVLFGRLRPYLKKVAIAHFGGVCSPEVLVLRARQDVILPGFLFLVASSDAVIDHATALSAGSRMPRTSFVDLGSYELLLPPLSVQRRIVDLMTHLDDHIDSSNRIADGLGAAQAPLMAALLDHDYELQHLGGLGEFIRGKRFTKSEYVPSGLGCIHYAEIHTHFGSVATECISFLPDEARTRLRLAHHGDVVIAATSEDKAGLGKATVWLGDGEVAAHDDSYIYRHRLDPRFAAYIFVSPTFQAQKLKYAGGSKVTRISGADLASIEIPVPPIAIQRDIGLALDALDSAHHAAQTEVQTLKALRGVILNGILSQEIEIPAAYDLISDDSSRVSMAAS